jgi:ATP-dependent DNA helicase RecG
MGTYKRRHSGDYPCTEEEVRQMLRDASPDPQDSTVFSGTTFSGIDAATFSAFRNVFRSNRPSHALLKLGDAELLTKLGGLKRDGLTLAGILMFGTADLIRDAFPNVFLDYYELLEPKNAAKRYDDRVTTYDGDWEPNLFNFFYKARPRLVEGLRTPFGLGEDAMRKGETPFHNALREALVNSLVHTDYLLRGTILIGKRGDAFVFQNSWAVSHARAAHS